MKLTLKEENALLKATIKVMMSRMAAQKNKLMTLGGNIDKGEAMTANFSLARCILYVKKEIDLHKKVFGEDLDEVIATDYPMLVGLEHLFEE